MDTQTMTTCKTFLEPAIKAGILAKTDYEKVLAAIANSEDTQPPQLITTREAARILSCCRKSILRLADAGRLTRIYLTPGAPKSLRFKESEVLAIAEGSCNDAA